ncbi:MAG: SDR family oxidoreductase [Fibrobacterota bacterium]
MDGSLPPLPEEPNRPLALITGASSGIGLELARHMAKKGWDLVLAARSREALAALSAILRREYNAGVKVVLVDLSQPGAADALFTDIQSSGIELDALVNNAGFGLFGNFAETDGEREERMIALNVAALTRLTKLVLPGMVARGRGRILNVASMAAFMPGPGMAVYFATKAYVLSFSEALSREIKGTGVTVTALCPGTVATRFEKNAGLESAGLFKRFRPMEPDTVAEFGYRAMLKGERVAVPGRLNRVMAVCLRMLPKRLLLTVVDRFLLSQTPLKTPE